LEALAGPEAAQKTGDGWFDWSFSISGGPGRLRPGGLGGFTEVEQSLEGAVADAVEAGFVTREQGKRVGLVREGHERHAEVNSGVEMD